MREPTLFGDELMLRLPESDISVIHGRQDGLGVTEYGEVFTRRWVVDLILDLCGYESSSDLTQLVLVEPSMGSGAFVLPVLERLIASRADRGVAWSDLAHCLRGWDLQAAHVQTCQNDSQALLESHGCPKADAKSLVATWLRHGDFLLTSRGDLEADVVVGNPPYIRIEDIEPSLLRAYRSACPTMTGRSDIFIGFYEHGLDLLRPEGRLGFICADRWMRNQYGARLRRKIVDEGFAMDVVLSMHDAPAFEEEVSAYPAVTVLRRGPQGEAIAGEAGASFGAQEAQRFSSWATKSKGRGARREYATAAAAAAALPKWHETGESWPVGGPRRLAWLDDISRSLPPLEDPATRTRLGIGVATGADKVFVVGADALPDVELERLLPLSMGADVKSGSFEWTGHYLVNPWDEHGQLVQPSEWPLYLKYMTCHEEAVRKRSVAQRSEVWYRTIDKVNYALTQRPMLLMEDMKAKAHPVLAPEGFYPHHNLYWVISDGWDLEVLGGLLLSDVVEAQVASYCVKMRGGTLRFQAQYLRRVRIPNPKDLSTTLAEDLASAFRARDRNAASEAALRAFKLDALPM